MENIKKIIQLIELGKQLGSVFSFKINGKIIWSSVAVQKNKGIYKVYVDEIEEDKMASESYLRDEIKKFNDLLEALNFIDSNTHAKSRDLKPCKGQKIFNPDFE